MALGTRPPCKHSRREERGEGAGGWAPLLEAHTGSERTRVGAVTGARPTPRFPAGLFPLSLSLSVCLSLHLYLFICLFEIMHRTKF